MMFRRSISRRQAARLVLGALAATLCGGAALSARAAELRTHPEALLGSWRRGTIHPTTFWDRSTGAYQGHAGGASMYYTFEKDGQYRMFVYIHTRSYGWEMRTWTEESGTYSLKGDRITLKPSGGKYRAEDNRVAKNNFTRPYTPEEVKKKERTLEWGVAEENGKTYFAYQTPGKEDAVALERVK